MADITVSANIHSFMQAANAGAARTVLEAAGLAANTFTAQQTLPIGSVGTPGLKMSTFGLYENSALGLIMSYAAAFNSVVLAYNGVYVPSNGSFQFSDTANNAATTGDLILNRAAAATLQLGNTDATTPTAQTIKAHNVTTGTGASLTLAGGTGSVAKGNVVLDGGNRAAYDASPSATVIRDILISHGLMAAS